MPNQVDQAQTSAYIPPLLAINSTDVCMRRKQDPIYGDGARPKNNHLGTALPSALWKSSNYDSASPNIRFRAPFAAKPRHGRGVAQQAHAQFHEDRIANMIFFGTADIKPRERNDLCIIITLTGASPGMIKFYPPSGQAMLLHQFGRCFNRISKWPMDGLFRL